MFEVLSNPFVFLILLIIFLYSLRFTKLKKINYFFLKSKYKTQNILVGLVLAKPHIVFLKDIDCYLIANEQGFIVKDMKKSTMMIIAYKDVTQIDILYRAKKYITDSLPDDIKKFDKLVIKFSVAKEDAELSFFLRPALIELNYFLFSQYNFFDGLLEYLPEEIFHKRLYNED